MAEEKILIVDDDIDTLQLVGTMLERQGFKIVAANNGQQALLKTQEESPDLIICDVMMPGMDGYEVTRQIRAMPEIGFIPIILFTAKSQVDDKVEGMEAGADDFLTKPTKPSELIARVKSILDRPKVAGAESGNGAAKADASTSSAADSTGQGMGKIIGVISAKGGMGVSTLALNVGVSLHQKTEDYVSIAEMRPGQGSIGLYLGYPPSDSLKALLAKEPNEISGQDVHSQLVTHGSGVQVLLASSNPADANQSHADAQAEAIVKHLARMSPYTVLDLGAGLTEISAKLLPLCETILVVTEPNPATITQTKQLLETLEASGIPGGKMDIVILNRVRLTISMPNEQVEKALGKSITGVITAAPELAYQAAMQHVPMVLHQTDSIATRQIQKIAEGLQIAPAE